MNASSKYIKYLWFNDRTSLISLFSMLRFFNISEEYIITIFKQCNKEGKTDFEIISFIKDIIDSSPKPPQYDNNNRGKTRGKELGSLLKKSNLNKPKMYLDIGANDGVVTKAIGNTFKLTKPNIHAVDMKNWIGQEITIPENVKTDINFSYITDNKCTIPHKDNKFDFITILQALHHFKDLDGMMKEIKRVCAPNGVIIIREHNAYNNDIKLLIDLEHLIYGILYDGVDLNYYSKDYFGVYRSSDEWDAIFASYGFKSIKKLQRDNPTKYYYSVYVKL